MAELVDALDLKSNWYLNASAGSSPARGTNPIAAMVSGFFMSEYFIQFAGREACPAKGKHEHSECREARPEVQTRYQKWHWVFLCLKFRFNSPGEKFILSGVEGSPGPRYTIRGLS